MSFIRCSSGIPGTAADESRTMCTDHHETTSKKSISSAIIAAAGLHCFAIGGLIDHDETQMFIMLVGALVGLVGLAAWGKTTLSQHDAKF